MYLPCRLSYLHNGGKEGFRDRMKLFTYTKRIGHTTYTVNAFTSDIAKESFEDITLRLFSHGNHGTLCLPQANRQSERSA